jgi:hypothetical protein
MSWPAPSLASTRQPSPTTVPVGGRPSGLAAGDGTVYVALRPTGTAHRGGTLTVASVSLEPLATLDSGH